MALRKNIIIIFMKILFTLSCLIVLSACGYKGALYLPKTNDNNRFDIIQTDVQSDIYPTERPQ